MDGFNMCEALKYKKYHEAKQELELAIRKFRSTCKENELKLGPELSGLVFRATDGKVEIDCIVEEVD